MSTYGSPLKPTISEIRATSGGLPLELWQVIFSYLPVHDLCRCAQVCKTWCHLVTSLDNTSWKAHFLCSTEWKDSAWPRNLDTHQVKSWQKLYRDHYTASQLWMQGARDVDQAQCMHLFRRRHERRTIYVGKGREHVSLKVALASVSAYDRIVVAPGLYDEQFEMASKIPFELVGEGEPGSVVLLTCIEQTALSARLCNILLRAPWFTAHVIKVVSGHLQLDNCIIEDGQVTVHGPGTLHMRYCSLVRTQTVFHQVAFSLIDNCEFIKCDACAITAEGEPRGEVSWARWPLLLAADTYKLHRHLETYNSRDNSADITSQQDSTEGSTCVIDGTTITSHSFADITQRSASATSVDSDDSSDLTDSESDYSNSLTATQPWLGHARTAWATDDKEPPLQWDSDPIPAIPACLQQDSTLRQMALETRGCVVRQCKLWQGQGGISVIRHAQMHVIQCEFRDLQYGIRCIQNTKVALLENIIHHCSSSAIFMRMGAKGIILGNDIYCTGEAGIDVRKQADPLIQHNRVHHIKRSGIVVLGSGKGTIKANDIYQNREAGIYILYRGDPYVSGNRICHGSASGIAVTESGRGYIVDNMISGNRWGGIDVRRGGDPHVTRNLICNGLADGIVIGTRGRGTIEANCIRGNMGCGIWIMSGRPLLQSNQIYSNKDSGIVLVNKEHDTMGDESLDGSDDSDSDSGDPMTTTSTSHGNHSGSSSSAAPYQIQIKFNSIYHNAGIGVMTNISDSVNLLANAIHANRNTGISVKQDMPVNILRCSVTCNAGCGLMVAPESKVVVEESGFYDNIGQGILAEGDIIIQNNDILCNQMSGVLAEGDSSVQIENNRLYSPYDPAVFIKGNSQAVTSRNKMYKGRATNPLEVIEKAHCKNVDNEIIAGHGHDSFDKRGFDWELENPAPRPAMEAPPRVNIPGTPARRVTSTARVVAPAGGNCQQGSKTCQIL